MTISENASLSRSLHELDRWKQIAFMTRIAERMLPSYQYFSAETAFGHPAVLREALDMAWSWLATGHAKESDLLQQLAVCEQQAPDTEDFRSSYTSAALDAANSVAAILEAVAGSTDPQPMEAVTLARDTIDLFVQEQLDLDPSSPDLEDTISNHMLMRDEARRQQEDSTFLKEGTGKRGELVRALRAKGTLSILPGPNQIE